MKDILRELIYAVRLSGHRDVWDYIAIIAPILLSAIAIIISLWNSVWLENKKKLEAFIVWDDLSNTFFVILKNAGKTSLVISSVTLYAYNKKTKEELELGTRGNIWAIDEKAYISQNEAIKYTPTCGSLYDIFAYKGHMFEVTDDIRDLKVMMNVVDTDGKIWKIKTNFTLGEIDDYLGN